MTTKLLTDRDAAADLAGEPRPNNVPPKGRVTVERWIQVSKTREHSNGTAEGGSCDQPVKFEAENYGGETIVHVQVTDDTSLHMNLDALVDITFALCPPWLLRKKLGL